MSQDQNTHTTNSNDNTVQQVSDNELHDITGGCIGCGIVGFASATASVTEMQEGVTNAVKKGDMTEVFKGGHRAAAFATIAGDSLKNLMTGEPSWKPCRACIKNIALYAATKLWRP
jgi:hypothetical protein